MTKTELNKLIVLGEGLSLEFKRSVSHLGREICAFANTSGGRILVGVSDEGVMTGVANANRAKSEIQNVARSMDPPLGLEIESVGDVLVVTVPSGREKPYSANGKFYLRDAATCQQMARDEIREFFFKEGSVRFDEQPCLAFRMPADLDAKKYRTFVNSTRVPAGLRRSDVLRNLHLVTSSGMTNAGALLFSKDVSQFFLQASLICVLFQGTSKTKVLDKRTFRSGVADDYQGAMEYLLSRLNAEYIIRGGPREEILELPEAALREAIINAIAHRDYRLTDHIQINVLVNRVEITNPGGLVAGLRKRDLGHVSRPRNPLLFSMMERMDLVENIGSGIKRMRDEMKAYSLPEPLIVAGDTWFSITFMRKGQHDAVMGGIEPAKQKVGERVGEKVGERLSVNQQRILDMMREDPGVTASQLANRLGISVRKTEDNIRKLREKGLIERIGPPRGGYWRLR
jgi:ATP-dependent DNA helicase RecG